MKILDKLNIFKRLRELEDKEAELDSNMDELRTLFAGYVDGQIARTNDRVGKALTEVEQMKNILKSKNVVDLDKQLIDLDVM